MRAIGSFLLIAFVVCFIACKEQTDTPISRVNNLIPKPQQLTEGAGDFIIHDSTGIYVTSSNDTLLRLAGNFAGMLQRAYVVIQLAPIDQIPPGSIVFNLAPGSSLGNEGYDLTVDTGKIFVQANQPAGIFYAIQTLRQLLPDEIETGRVIGEYKIQACHIKDKPRYSYRGAMLDVARHFFSVEDVKRFIDLIAFYKINTLHLGLTNDQGWRIEIKSWPDLTRIGGSSSVHGDRPGFYTQEQYKDIVKYAQEKYITIIPEIDMPGHTNAALASYAILNCNDTATALYTGIDVGFSSFCIHKDITYKFVDDVIKELSEITPGPYIHIGGDESHSTKKEDYKYFIEKVALVVQKYGKRPIGWEEVATAKLPANSIAQFWDKAPNATAAVAQHVKIIMSPSKKAYLDMQYDSTSKLGLHWAAYVEIDSSYQWDPATYIPGVSEQHILGVEAPLWAETLHNMDDIEYMAFPRLPGIAEISWSPATNRHWDEYKQRLAQHGERMKAMDIDFYRSKQIPWK